MLNNKIVVLTYNHPHRKTQDVIFRLLALGYNNLFVLAKPWVARKNFEPIYQHRPSNCFDIQLENMCENLGLSFFEVDSDEMPLKVHEINPNHILIAGAGILPSELSNNFKIVNSHPGYLPYCKGLDALKWAILNEKPIGVTSHFISDKADEGILIDQKLVPIYREDTFHSLAYRQYEMEIELLIDSISITPKGTSLADDTYQATRRMPHSEEEKMMLKFEELRAKSAFRKG